MLPKTAKDTKDSQSRLDFFLMLLVLALPLSFWVLASSSASLLLVLALPLLCWVLGSLSVCLLLVWGVVIVVLVAGAGAGPGLAVAIIFAGAGCLAVSAVSAGSFVISAWLVIAVAVTQGWLDLCMVAAVALVGNSR